jgi:hypothetical protein
MRVRLLTVIVVAVAASACGAQVSSPGSRGGSASNLPVPQVSSPVTPTSSRPTATRLPLSGARATVQAYVDAWDRHDPAAICRQQAAVMRR